ncbi:MAG: hypothetical protein HN348_16165 [Proteobacteria bacterium]|nr:hypothetical protein [Pseudomonadota bacterium]
MHPLETGLRQLFAIFLVVATCLYGGCAIKIGSGLVEGALLEASGEGKSKGIEGIVNSLVERQILGELGQQLGAGLSEGATEITPEQRANLEAAIDGAVTVALMQAGKGIRNEVSPELRAMVRRDIVEALAEGIRGDIGDSLEETIDRIITRAVTSLTRGFGRPEMRFAMADFLRESIYMAMREGQGYTPGVGETLEATLTENMLGPIETSVDGLATTVASKVDESARRTEKTLQAIISALVLVIGAMAIMYFVNRKQLLRQKQQATAAQAGLRTFDAALGILDESTRREIRGKVDEYQALVETQEEEEQDRSDQYLRK